MEKSWVNSVKCLLDRLYKLCLTYLYFFGIYFNVEFFFRILGGRKSLISSNQKLFLSIFLLKTCFSHTTSTKKKCFSITINCCCSNYFYYQINYFCLKMDILNFLSISIGWNHQGNILKYLNTFGRKFKTMEYFYKKLILPKILLKTGEITSRERVFFHMVQQVLS